MSDEIDLFRSFLSKKGLRNTPEREEIITEIFASHDHFDVDELFLRLRKRGSKVSHASIYRNMPLIKECGLIREVWHEDGHMHYEHIYGHSHHCHTPPTTAFRRTADRRLPLSERTDTGQKGR